MILLTGFTPFGPKGWVTGTNASAEVLDRIMARRGGRYGSGVLPTGPECVGAYGALLASQRWTGLLAMGETGMIDRRHVVLERFANDVSRPAVIPLVWYDRVESAFATAAAAERKGNVSTGAYWCNRIHLEALRWSQGHGRVPVAFVHVPAVIGADLPLYGRHVERLYEGYTDEVVRILDQMEMAR